MIYLLLMAAPSKVAAPNNGLSLKNVFSDLLFRTNRRKAFSGGIFLIIVFLIYIRNKRSTADLMKISGRTKTEPNKGGKGNVDWIFWQRIKKLLVIVIPTWKCQEVLDLCMLTVFLVLRTFLSIYLASVNGKIVKAIIERNSSLFIERIFRLGLLAVPASFVNSFLDFLNKRLSLNFKRRLTNHFHETYLKDMVFYQLGNLDSRVTNPDQRLTADIEKWAQSLSTIYSNFSKPTLDIILFSRKLSQLVGWQGPLAIVLWYLLSGSILKLVSPPFGLLTAIEQRLEGDYRASQSDIVHHAEQIAFYKGNEWERTRINTMFNKFISHSEGIMNKKLFMGFFDSMLVKYGAVMVGYAVLGLPVFGPGSEAYLAKIGSDHSGITRDYIRNSSLLINLAKAIGRLVISYKEVQQLAGFTTLVYEMKEVLNDLDRGKFVRTQVASLELKKAESSIDQINQMNVGQLIQTSEDYIEFDHVPITSPNGDCLIREMSFRIDRKMHTVVTGPNGCGKSSLFRILSGLWPLKGGVLTRPCISKLFYIPQRPYLPPGTLRDQIIYPHNKQMMQRNNVTNDDLRELLRHVQLEAIELREGGFDSINEWNDVLSGGEKQRIAMARLFYHKPVFAVLDECTSAVSIDIEAELYRKAKELGITLFTVSHRSSLFKFHDFKISFDGNGRYEMKKIDLK